MAFLGGFFCGDECQDRKNTKAEAEKIKAQAMLQATQFSEQKTDYTIIFVAVFVCILIITGVVILKKMKII